jgi:hypothetical protein
LRFGELLDGVEELVIVNVANHAMPVYQAADMLPPGATRVRRGRAILTGQGLQEERTTAQRDMAGCGLLSE